MQPSHFCNWKHFSCHWSTLFTHHLSSRPCCDPWVRNGEGQPLPPVYPAGTAARSSSNPTSNNLQGVWKATLHVPQPRTLSRLFISGVAWGGRTQFPPGSAAGRGTHALPRLLEPQQPRESVAVFICQKQRKKVRFLFKKKCFFTLG